MKLPIRVLAIAFSGFGLLALGACASTAQPASPAVPPAQANGPAADYPVVIGDPFTIDGVVYTPVDTLNYDRVGYVTVDENAVGVTGSHRTLPLPSYVEVTALDTGRTILVRLERRGPMTNDRLLGLSSAALAQLGVGESAPIRMRRVNPPEEQRAELRAGREAPPRMDTPQGLLEVLKRRLPERGSAPLGDPRQAEVSGTVPIPGPIARLDPNEEAAVSRKPVEPAEQPLPPPAERPGGPELPRAYEGGPTPAPVMVQPASDGRFAVQLGAFAVHANADRLAREVQGYVEDSGSLAIVRVGPFATRGQAEEALAKLRERGYSDALIKTLD